MTRSAAASLRLLAALALVAALVVLLASLLVGSAAAAPNDDVVGDTDDIVVADEPTEPTTTPAGPTATRIAEFDTELTPVAEPGTEPTPIPSVSPGPSRNPSDVTGDLPEELLDDPGTGDLIVTSETCDSPVPGQIADRFCSPAASSGYVAYLYAGTSNTYTIAYEGPLPVDRLDVPGGPYMLSAGPIPPLMQLKMVCRVEDAAGNPIETLTGSTFILLTIGHDRVYRCVVYTLAEGNLPTENAPVEPTDGPVEVIVTEHHCPPGTDPTLNYFGLIGRCTELGQQPRWAAYGPAGGAEVGDLFEDGTVSMTLNGGVWTLTTRWPAGDHAPVMFCNVRDELYQEPPQYAPFMTYHFSADTDGAVLTLEQHMTWRCDAYFVPAATGDGSDVARITVTAYACSEGTTTPTVAACAQTLDDITFHLLFGTETIVATRPTDANGVVTFAGPENLGAFGLAEDVPAGFLVAPYALCAENGGEPIEVPVIAGAVVDLGDLAGGDAVDCAWFNVVTTAATAPASLDLEVDAELADPGLAPVDEADQQEPPDDADPDAPNVLDDHGDEEPSATQTPESDRIVPLEEDE